MYCFFFGKPPQQSWALHKTKPEKTCHLHFNLFLLQKTAFPCTRFGPWFSITAIHNVLLLSKIEAISVINVRRYPLVIFVVKYSQHKMAQLTPSFKFILFASLALAFPCGETPFIVTCVPRWYDSESVFFPSGIFGNPHAKRLYDDLLSNYNRLIRPVPNNTGTLTVRLGLKLSQLIDVVSL